jgi:hypothetical protein
MDTNIAEKLREEIETCRKLRHGLIMRKLTFLTTFAGLGSLAHLPLPGEPAESRLIYLLYLVPFIAVAFDIYIFLEDYRIKRAGEFLKRLVKVKDLRYEALWEHWVEKNPNTTSTYAFLFVTSIFMAASSVLLYRLGAPWSNILGIFSLAGLVEGMVVWSHRHLRIRLRACELSMEECEE